MRLDHLLFKENQKALRSHDKNSGLSKESPEGVRVTLLFLCSKSLKSSATLGRAFLFLSYNSIRKENFCNRSLTVFSKLFTQYGIRMQFGLITVLHFFLSVLQVSQNFPFGG